MSLFPTKQIHRFTMIEILVVMGIIAILLGMTTPAFTRLTRGSAVEIAARTLSSQITIARAEAIRHRKTVALILPDHNFQAPSGDSLSVYPYTAYRLAFVTGSSSPYTFEKWLPNSQWQFLPMGAIVAFAEDSAPGSAIELASDKYVPKEKLDDGTPTKEANFVKNNAGTLTVIKIGEEETKDSSEDKYKARAIIFKPNGQYVGANVLTIMEGNYDKEEKKLIRLNTSNVIVQRIEKFSGRVTYLYNGKL